jgi:CheY-like chemotaxis protein
MNQQKILIVDDSAVILRALSMKLHASGYQAFTAADASQALALVRKEVPDLIVLDLGFPPDVAHGGTMTWDGFVIMQWLQRSDPGKDIPVIIITGDLSEKTKKRALAAGAARFFQKPVDNDELVAAIRQCLEKAQAPTPPNPPA